MRRIIKKFVLGDKKQGEFQPTGSIVKRINNIKAIWNNDHQDDNGIEKIVRLFLSCSQFLFPGIYIKYLACKRGYEYQDLALDFYVVVKVVFPFLTLMYAWQSNSYIVFIHLPAP